MWDMCMGLWSRFGEKILRLLIIILYPSCVCVLVNYSNVLLFSFMLIEVAFLCFNTRKKI